MQLLLQELLRELMLLPLMSSLINLTTVVLWGDSLNLDGQTLPNVNSLDVVNKNYVDGVLARQDGLHLNSKGNKIRKISEPTARSYGATKEYVDSSIGNLLSFVKHEWHISMTNNLIIAIHYINKVETPTLTSDVVTKWYVLVVANCLLRITEVLL